MEAVNFEREDLEVFEEELDEALERRKKFKAMYRDSFARQQEAQKTMDKIIALRNGTEDYVTPEPPPFTPRPPVLPPPPPAPQVWPQLEPMQYVTIVDNYCDVVNESFIKPLLRGMVESVAAAFDMPATPRSPEELLVEEE